MSITVITDAPRREAVQSQGVERQTLLEAYRDTRAQTERLCAPLEIEDFVIQTSPDVSPAKWHLAHTTWFFETFLLSSFVPAYRPVREEYRYLFNSYYQAVGPRHARPQRGFISRPTVKEIFTYRAEIDQRMPDLLNSIPEAKWGDVAALTTLGIHHEQQHQELLLTDLKHNFWTNPLKPAYRTSAEGAEQSAGAAGIMGWIPFAGGVHAVGHHGSGFCFDNELPQHRVYLEDFELADRLVTNGEYLEFMDAGGYREPKYWLSDGWDWVQREMISAPLHWTDERGSWHVFTLDGLKELNPSEPVCHVSYYEAEAYAAWRSRRLPTEAEWEVAALTVEQSRAQGNLLESSALHPLPMSHPSGAVGPFQMFGDVWEWTNSAYLPYPGYKAAPGALGEYNGKFMSGQMVLKGGSCATPREHIRASYRNFFQPDKRWQFTGIRLAADL
ncbi:MAG TPA: ergothioneine biosynthesis protein EgtB [bacterium]|jgi:ergothioneine biosynthesis protein EgtB